MTVDHDLLPADRLAPAELHAAFVDAFADYLAGPFTLPLAGWPAFLARQCVDLGASRAACRDGRVVAFALAAPRGPDRWRLATMGAVPAARGGGVAAALLADLASRATHAGVQALELEVFAQNARAVRLYARHGFEPVHALFGYTVARAQPPAKAHVAAADEVVEVPLDAAFAWLDQTAARVPDLPLQVLAASLAAAEAAARTVRAAAPVAASATAPGAAAVAASGGALRALRCGEAQLVFAPPADGAAAVVHCLIDRTPGAHRQADAEALGAALLARCAGAPIRVPQLQRHDLGGAALERLGFVRAPLWQELRVRRLGGGAAVCDGFSTDRPVDAHSIA